MREDCKRAYKTVLSSIESKDLADIEDFRDLFAICQHGFLGDAENKEEYKKYSDYIKETALRQVTKQENQAETWRSIYWDTVKLEAFWFFESYLLYMEHKRDYEKRFYEPRKMTQHVVVEDLQKLEDSKTLKMYTLSEPARIGKSGMIMFFLSWIILRHPHSHNAMGTYSGPAAKHFYDEILKIFTEDEYCFQELYSYFQPKEKFLTDKSAEQMSISFTGTESFPTICFRGIDGSWTGIVDISDDGYLAVDDLIRDREHALSKSRTDKTFAEYMNKMVDRMHQHSKQLMIGTLWNINDPIMRLMEMNKDDPNYLFRKIPALNENGESNFDYEYNGYNTEYYVELRNQMIEGGMDADWMAKFQQSPYMREGQLFPLDELSYFNGILPQGHKFRFAVNCDVAFGGGDSVSMPIGVHDLTENIIYIVDWYFSSSGVMVTVPGVVDMIIKHGIKNVTFEANAGGNLYASKVQEELKSRGYLCACDSVRAPNNASKEDKIKSCEGVIRQKFRFLDGTKHKTEEYDQETKIYERSAQYNRALEEMSTYVTVGKTPHDDACDSIAQIAERVFDTLQRRTVIMDSPF